MKEKENNRNIHMKYLQKMTEGAYPHTLTSAEAVAGLFELEDDERVRQVLSIIENGKGHASDGRDAEKLVCLKCLLDRYGVLTKKKASATPDAIAALFRGITYGEQQEKFMAAYLDGANQVMEVDTITTGMVNRSLVHSREVYARAIELRAAAVVVGHNHPSGDKAPSKCDIALTNSLAEAARVLRIPLLDHIIVTDDDFFSFSENHFL